MRMLKTSSTPVSMTIGIARLASLLRRARATSNPSERWSIMTSSTTMSGGAAAIAASASRPFAAVRTSYRVSSTADTASTKTASWSTSRTEFFAMALSPEPSDSVDLGDALEQVEHHAGADAAWRALAARLLDEELEEEARQLDHAGAVVEDDEPAGAHDRTELLQRLIVDRHVGGGGRDAAAGGPSRLSGFEAAG